MDSDNIEMSETQLNQARKLPFIEIFLRSFFLQTLMNYPRMQGLGFGTALLPLARATKLSGKKLVEFLRRHFDFFNSHPYMASYAIGAVVRLESEGVSGDKISAFKRGLVGPLGLFGDQIFWARFKPLCAAISVLLLLMFDNIITLENTGARLIILAGFLIAYNSAHIAVRWRGLAQGFEFGESVLQRITRSRMVKLRLHLGILGGLTAGLILAKTLSSVSGAKMIYLWSFAAALICLKLKSPLWLTVLTALSVSIAIFFIMGIKLQG